MLTSTQTGDPDEARVEGEEEDQRPCTPTVSFRPPFACGLGKEIWEGTNFKTPLGGLLELIFSTGLRNPGIGAECAAGWRCYYTAACKIGSKQQLVRSS
jgi:hypothetical protein